MLRKDDRGSEPRQLSSVGYGGSKMQERNYERQLKNQQEDRNAAIDQLMRDQAAALRPPEPEPIVNAPAGGLPPEFGGGGGGGGMVEIPSEMPNGGVPAGTTPAEPTSPWSYKAPQLQVGVTDPAPPIQYDYSHLQRQPLQSAGEQFAGSTETARALRAGLGDKYRKGGA